MEYGVPLEVPGGVIMPPTGVGAVYVEPALGPGREYGVFIELALEGDCGVNGGALMSGLVSSSRGDIW